MSSMHGQMIDGYIWDENMIGCNEPNTVLELANLNLMGLMQCPRALSYLDSCQNARYCSIIGSTANSTDFWFDVRRACCNAGCGSGMQYFTLQWRCVAPPNPPPPPRPPLPPSPPPRTTPMETLQYRPGASSTAIQCGIAGCSPTITINNVTINGISCPSAARQLAYYCAAGTFCDLSLPTAPNLLYKSIGCNSASSDCSSIPYGCCDPQGDNITCSGTGYDVSYWCSCSMPPPAPHAPYPPNILPNNRTMIADSSVRPVISCAAGTTLAISGIYMGTSMLWECRVALGIAKSAISSNALNIASIAADLSGTGMWFTPDPITGLTCAGPGAPVKFSL